MRRTAERSRSIWAVFLAKAYEGSGQGSVLRGGITFALLRGARRAMVRGREQTRKGEGHVTQDCSSRPHGIACGIGSAYGQEPTAGPAFVEVTYMPAGAAFFASKDDAPEFFGRDNRYAHRVYGGVIINTVR